MQPIGLTTKDVKTNPFTNRTSGELMIIHICMNCQKISTNRIAGDDNSYSLISLLEASKNIDFKLINLLTNQSISLLTDKDQVLTTLFGYNYPKF